VYALQLAYQSVGWEWPFLGMRRRLGRVAYETAYSTFARHRRLISGTLSPLVSIIEWIQARRVAQQMQRCMHGKHHCEIDSRTGNPSR
jgi:hypothetical protein